MRSRKIHLIFIAVSYLFVVVNAKSLIWRISDDLKVGKNLHKEYDPYWTSRKNSLELIELSSINKVSLV